MSTKATTTQRPLLARARVCVWVPFFFPHSVLSSVLRQQCPAPCSVFFPLLVRLPATRFFIFDHAPVTTDLMAPVMSTAVDRDEAVAGDGGVTEPFEFPVCPVAAVLTRWCSSVCVRVRCVYLFDLLSRRTYNTRVAVYLPRYKRKLFNRRPAGTQRISKTNSLSGDRKAKIKTQQFDNNDYFITLYVLCVSCFWYVRVCSGVGTPLQNDLYERAGNPCYTPSKYCVIFAAWRPMHILILYAIYVFHRYIICKLWTYEMTYTQMESWNKKDFIVGTQKSKGLVVCQILWKKKRKNEFNLQRSKKLKRHLFPVHLEII